MVLNIAIEHQQFYLHIVKWLHRYVTVTIQFNTSFLLAYS